MTDKEFNASDVVEPGISVCSILALGFNHIKTVLIWFLLGMFIFGGYTAYKNCTAKVVVPDENAMIEWELSYSVLATKLDSLNKQLEYLNNEAYASSLMDLNPSEAVKTVISFAVDSENTANQYVNYFNSIKIDEELRELVSFELVTTNNIIQDVDTRTSTLAVSTTNRTDTNTHTGTITEYSFDKYFKNCFLRLTVYGADENTTKADAKRLMVLIEAGKDVVTAISGEHNLLRIDEYSESGMKEVVALQYEKAVQIEEVVDEILSLNSELVSLEKSKPSSVSTHGLRTIIKSSIKWAVIGAVLGAFLECLYLLIGFIGASPVTSSFEFADFTGLAYLGGAFKKRNWNERTADKLMNERVFASDADASSFISENVKAIAKGGKSVLVASSFYKASDRENADVAIVMNALQAAGCSAEFAGDALTSAAFVAKLGTADSVIILEKRWNSRWQNIGTELETINRLEKNVAGFVLI